MYNSSVHVCVHVKVTDQHVDDDDHYDDDDNDDDDDDDELL